MATSIDAVVGVVVATCDRPSMLSERSIPSILNQTYPPKFVIIVDDSRYESNRALNTAYVKSITSENTIIELVPNRRSPGACGAWNSGIDLLSQMTSNIESTFVAILDDDDSWRSNYLETCISTVQNGGYDMVATDMIRIESISGPSHKQPAPESLCVDDFLVTNPGIQGSNLFLRLSIMLMAGCFDESMITTTDRDLCIRIAELEKINFGRIPLPLVEHFAESNRNRLTLAGSESKHKGLTRFWRKYAGRMNLNQRKEFVIRAENLFYWTPTDEDIEAVRFHVTNRMERLHPQNNLKRKSPPLIIGVITNEPKTCLNLLRSIDRYASNSTVYILDNGSPINELESLLIDVNDMSISVYSISQKEQIIDAKSGIFGEVFQHRPKGTVGIAQARTMIQRYVGRAMIENPASIGWILDDDMHLDERASWYLPFLNEFKDSGVHVLLGSYVGSSPNPPLNGVRVQLVDILHNLHWLEHLPPHDTLPDRREENRIMRKKFPDYYYDLSRKHTSHLEYPNWVEPLYSGETVVEARARLLYDAERLCHGHPVTRPLISELQDDPVECARDSVNRGGCTFILDSKALTLTPNLIMYVGGNEVRRSDMIWAIINRYRRNLVVKSVNFPVVHEARFASSNGLNFDKVRAEIFGSAIYAGLTSFLNTNSSHQLDFTPSEVDQILQNSQRFYSDRVFRLERSLYRVKGLLGAIREILDEEKTPSWIGEIDAWASSSVIDSLKEIDFERNRSEFVEFLNSIGSKADDYSISD